MKVLTKVKEFGKSIVNAANRKKTAIMASIATAMVMVASPVYASGDIKPANWKGGGDINSMIGSVIGMMLAVAQYAGMALAIWGIVKTVMAYKDDNVNEITQGIRLAVVGVILVALRSVLTGLGFIG